MRVCIFPSTSQGLVHPKKKAKTCSQQRKITSSTQNLISNHSKACVHLTSTYSIINIQLLMLRSANKLISIHVRKILATYNKKHTCLIATMNFAKGLCIASTQTFIHRILSNLASGIVHVTVVFVSSEDRNFPYLDILVQLTLEHTKCVSQTPRKVCMHVHWQLLFHWNTSIHTNTFPKQQNTKSWNAHATRWHYCFS